jgi:hypothetical protein
MHSAVIADSRPAVHVSCFIVKVKRRLKVKFTLEQATKAQRGVEV